MAEDESVIAHARLSHDILADRFPHVLIFDTALLSLWFHVYDIIDSQWVDNNVYLYTYDSFADSNLQVRSRLSLRASY